MPRLHPRPLITGLEESVLLLRTAFLASEEAAFITATHNLADGGYTAQ